MSRKCDHFMKLLTMMCTLIACQVSAQMTVPVEYKGVLKSRASTIQSEITQFYDVGPNFFKFHHSPVQSDDFFKTVVFVWASERETYAMRSCLYQEMITIANSDAERLKSTAFTETGAYVKFCNRSMSICVYMENVNKVIILSLYFHDKENNDGLLIQQTATGYDKSDIPTAISGISFSSMQNIDDHVQTLVCNSIQLTLDEPGKLRQQFFSIVRHSRDIMIKPNDTLNVNVTIILDFDVLALNAVRLGLLNDSNTELFSLSQLHVSCIKYNQHGVDNEADKITDVNTTATEELEMATKSMIIDEKLRLYVNVSISVVSDHNFGDYSCSTLCKLQSKYSNRTTDGCRQVKYFSVMFNYWRYRHTVLNANCINTLTNLNKTCNQGITNIRNIFKETKRYVDSLIHKSNELIQMAYFAIISLKVMMLEIVSLKGEKQFYALLAIILFVLTAVILGLCAYREVKNRINLRTYISVESVLQSMENRDDRNVKYDVFLSYSSKDRSWVETELLKFIQSKGFRVCFDERDFLLGCNLVETIARAVSESRKVIAVVSPNYLESRWCAKFEFVLTYTKILNKEAPYNSLLLIKYKDCQMPEHMKCLKYLDYTKVTTVGPRDDNRSVAMKAWSCVLKLFRGVEVLDAFSEKQFFDLLFSWLGKLRNANHPECRGRNTHKNRTQTIRNRGKITGGKSRR